MAANCQWTFLLKKAISVIYLLEIGLTFREKSLKIVLTEGWQSGNAPDSKSGEPVKWRAGSIPVLSSIFNIKNALIVDLNGF